MGTWDTAAFAGQCWQCPYLPESCLHKRRSGSSLAPPGDTEAKYHTAEPAPSANTRGDRRVAGCWGSPQPPGPPGQAVPTQLPPYAGMAVNPGPSTQRWVPASMPKQVSRGTSGCRVRAAEDPGWKQGEHGAGRPPAAQGTEALCPQNAKAVPEHPRHRERQPARPVWQHRGCILSHGAASCGEEQGARLQHGESLGGFSPQYPPGTPGECVQPTPAPHVPGCPT